MTVLLTSHNGTFIALDRCRTYKGQEYWTALKKKAATVKAPTYSVDGNPSNLTMWASDEPNENEECLRLTIDFFRDHPCSSTFLYVCKMPAGESRSTSSLVDSWYRVFRHLCNLYQHQIFLFKFMVTFGAVF